jgi:hypothetical protein
VKKALNSVRLDKSSCLMMRYAFDGIRLGPYLIDLKIAERAAFFAES